MAMKLAAAPTTSMAWVAAGGSPFFEVVYTCTSLTFSVESCSWEEKDEGGEGVRRCGRRIDSG